MHGAIVGRYTMTENERAAVRANIFSPALGSVEPWDTFRWHCNQRGECQTRNQRSSQALAIDVFGCLKVAEQSVRNAVFDRLATTVSVPVGGNWSVELEWVDPDNRLNEHPEHPTQVDVVAKSERVQIFIECKFAEYRFSHCSQTNPIRRQPQCSGTYAMQQNPLNRIASRCALSGKGIRYWDVVPQVFELRSDVDHVPCPFSGDLYQWMRNAVLGCAVCEGTGLKTGFVAMYADSPGLRPAQEMPALARTFQGMLRPDGVAFASISFQRFLQQSLGALHEAECRVDVWQALIEWVETKIRRVAHP